VYAKGKNKEADAMVLVLEIGKKKERIKI